MAERFPPHDHTWAVVPHVKFSQGEGAMGTAGNSAKSVHNDREEGQQGELRGRIRLVVSRLPLGHESSQTPEFSAEWMVNQETQAVQKLSRAVQPFIQIVLGGLVYMFPGGAYARA
jgi:hypothetical protein